MFEPDLLRDKRVLITGGGTGLGLSTGRRLLELGASLVICGRRAEVLDEAAAELGQETGGEVATFACDIRDSAAVEAMIDAIWRDRPLDALINNAAGNFVCRSEDLSPGAVDAVVGIVLKGSANCTLACGRRWLEDGRPGNVISIVTTYAWTGSPYVLPSAMGKAGVLAMTRSLAVEWGGRGIRLNAIAPGPFPTEGAWSRLLPRDDLAETFETRNPLGRPGAHRELADLVAYLLADGSGFVNGEVVTIDGGEWLKGAAQFGMLDVLSDAEWEAIRPKRRKG